MAREGEVDMIRLRRLLLASLLVVWIGTVLACAGRVKKPGPPQQEVDPAAAAKPNQPPAPGGKPVRDLIDDGAKPTEPTEPSWASPDKAVRQGDLQVRITKVSVGKVPLKDFGRESRSADALLRIQLELINVNPTKKVEYRSWAGADFALDDNYATLRDNFGNNYRRITFGFASTPVGGVSGSESIYPNKTVTDVLVFEMPLDNATHLDLGMPAKNYACEGMIRYRIPLKFVSRE
jgi:hypothetical protein